jgi:hypothetical protein
LDNPANILIVNHILASRRTLTMTNLLLLLSSNSVLERFHCPLLLSVQGMTESTCEPLLEPWPSGVESNLDEVLSGGVA